MGFKNAYCYVDGERPKTKKALKAALRDNPESVTFDRMTDFDRDDEIPANALYIPRGLTLSICGPDPDRDRKWYASVFFNGEQIVCT